MRISDGRDCPVRPDDELACLAYPTLTDFPERPASGPGHRPPQKKSHWKRWLLLLAVITAAGLMLLQQKAGANYSPDLVLKNFDRVGISEYAFGTQIRKMDVTSITFLDSLKDAPGDAVDVSETGNGKVLLWAENGSLTIAGDGKVFFPADSGGLFKGGYKNLKQIVFQNAVDTSCVTDMSRMFHNCRTLTSLDVSGFNTGNVTDMSEMFYYCDSLTSLDVSGFDTGSVTDMGYMFYYCDSLTSLDVGGFDTGNVTNMHSMFSACKYLTSLDVSSFDTGNVTDMHSMFHYCYSLADLNLSRFDTENVTDMGEMFYYCHGLTNLEASRFDTGNVTDMYRMFSACSPDLTLITNDQRIRNQFLEDTR